MASGSPATARLVNLVMRMEFRDWTLLVIPDIPEDHLIIRFHDVDAYTGERRAIQFALDWPEEAIEELTDLEIASVIYDHIVQEVYRHEAAEFFLLDGERPFDPHRSQLTDNRYATKVILSQVLPRLGPRRLPRGERP